MVGVPAGHADTVEALKGMSLLIAGLEEMSEELRQMEVSLRPGGQICVGDLRLDHPQVARLKDNVLQQSSAVRDILRTILGE